MCAVCGCEGVVHEHEHEHEHGAGLDHQHAHDHEHGDGASRTVQLEHAVLGKNARFAAENRARFAARRVFAVDVLGGPGAGKTALLERYLRERPPGEEVAVVEGDLATANDADRIRAAGAPVVQINTGAVCHLDAHMLGHALDDLPMKDDSTLFVENVGNLVCPAMFDLGVHERLVVFSVTEGEDKPLKYPHMFAAATAVVLSKLDLVPHLDVDVARAERNVREVNPRAAVLRVSARTGEGMGELRGWVAARAAAVRAARGAS
jgi:hydrogenase nickel incorporation protein HypB